MKTAVLSVVLIGLSGAAIAQVSGAPIEQKAGDSYAPGAKPDNGVAPAVPVGNTGAVANTG